MKRLSIKLRVTLWYTLLMLVVVLFSMAALLAISRSVMERDARSQLMQVVEYNADEVDYDDGELEIDDDFDYYKAGIHSLVYDQDFRLAGGQVPSDFAAEVPLEDGEARSVESGGRRYYVYDYRVSSKGSPDLWVRGIMPAEEGTGAIGTITRVAVIVLPFIVGLAACGGYLIARQSLRPIEQVARTADEIGSGKDLSRRIGLGPGQDEIHRLADTFDEMFSRLERSFESEKQFTADASHELKTPVSVILAQCDYALQHIHTEEEYREALEVVRRQAGRMSQIVAQLLNFTRLEQGVETVNPEPTDLSELIEILCEEYAPEDSRGMQLHTEVAPGIFANVDRAMAARLVSNLLDNAYRYGKQGGNIWLRLYTAQEETILSVADDGPGIRPEELPKIWRRFYQVNPSRTPEENGLGLGLAMVRQIATLHGGRAEAESIPGQGAVFTVVFPKL